MIWLISGCTSLSEMPRPERAPAWSTWSRVHGGLVEADHASALTSRADRALERVAGDATTRHVCIRVLDEDRVGAYAWRDGSIFVTRGLLRVMDDEELDAAIAHEMAHLGTRGATHDAHRESHHSETVADAHALEILQATGHRPEAMLEMLAALSPHMPRELAPSLSARIALVRDRIESGTATADARSARLVRTVASDLR